MRSAANWLSCVVVKLNTAKNGWPGLRFFQWAWPLVSSHKVALIASKLEL
jgi:hypothetical protein